MILGRYLDLRSSVVSLTTAIVAANHTKEAAQFFGVCSSLPLFSLSKAAQRRTPKSKLRLRAIGALQLHGFAFRNARQITLKRSSNYGGGPTTETVSRMVSAEALPRPTSVNCNTVVLLLAVNVKW